MLKQFILFTALIFSCTSLHAVAPITTNGNQVLIGGEPGSLAGNSFFWSNFQSLDPNISIQERLARGNLYYNENVVSWLKEDWNSTIVRAAMGIEEFNGFISNPNANRNAVRAVVDAAIANDIYVIIDWHTHNAEDHAQEAVDFFSEMAQEYGDHENVIFEIYNEPIGDFNAAAQTWQSIRNYAGPVIAAIRQHSDNLIIVGTPFFSQRVDIASQDPITGVENLAYTLHFYAGTHGEGLRQYARTALNNGIPLFVTEWGTVDASGDGAVDQASTEVWMDFLQDNNISHLNWAINDKDEGSSALIGDEFHANNQGNWPLSLLSDSGRLVRDIILNWPAASGFNNEAPNTPTDPQRASIPSLIQAEDFDRQSGIETEPTTDVGGGENIGFIDHNDYVEYDVNVRRAGTYEIQMRLASNTIGGDVELTLDGNDIATLSVGFTGGWQDWVTVTTEAELPAGNQTLRATFINPQATAGMMNVNWIDFNSTDGTAFIMPILDLILNDD